MDIYKEGIRKNLKVQTTNGMLTIYQLWSASLVVLTNAAKELNKQLKVTESDELSFLDSNAPKTDPIVQLRFDIVKDIYLTKSKEAKARLEAKNQKEELQHLLDLKAQRQLKAKEEMSDADLDKAIEELNKKQ
jgi:hypothetical protein